MLFTCERTVCSEMKSRFAISSVSRRSSSSSRISTSRAVSSAAIESGMPVSRPPVSRTVLEQAPRDRARQRRLAARHASQELEDPLRRLALQQVARRARADRAEQRLLRAGRGEHDDLGVGRRLPKPRQRLDAAHAGQRQVEQDEIRPQLSGALDRALGVGRVAGDVEAALPEQRGERVARQGMVVDDEDPDGIAS